MKRTAYDYSGFRLSKLNDPRFCHVKLLVTWLIYFAFYFLTENLIPISACHVMHSKVDDMIPFCEYFVIFYTAWFLLVAGSHFYYLRYSPRKFAELDLYIFVTQFIAMTCYILYPSCQDLRPETFPRENFFTWIMSIIYAFDTCTGVCPSLHVAYSLAIFSVIAKDAHVSKLVKVLLFIFVVMVALATMFVKQHSFIDVMAAIPTALVGEILIYHTKLGRKLTERYPA